MGFEQALIEEIADLERELEADPRFQKLRVLQTALSYYQPMASAPQLAAYQTSADAENASSGSSATAPARVNRYAKLSVYKRGLKRKSGRQRDPERQRALDEAVRFVQEHGGMPTTAEVFAHITNHGFRIGGQSPQGNLSAMLYKDGRLISHGRAGWTFGSPPTDIPEAERASEENEPSDAGASDGSDAGSDEERLEASHPTYPFHPAS